MILTIRKDQRTQGLIETGVFSLNFLDTSQEDLARKFSRSI